MKKQIRVYTGIVIFLICTLICIDRVKADDSTAKAEFPTDTVKEELYNDDTRTLYLKFSCRRYDNEALEFTLSSSDSDIIEVPVEYQQVSLQQFAKYCYVPLTVKRAGVATITLSFGGKEYTRKYQILPGAIQLNAITQSNYKAAKVVWKTVAGCDGYIIEQAPINTLDYTAIKSIDGANTSTTYINPKWNKKYTYRVMGYIKDGNEKLISTQYEYSFTKNFILEKIGATISSVKKTGSSEFVVAWKKISYATGYRIYRSTKENGGYKCVYTAKSGNVCSFKQKVSKNLTYYYKLVTIYPGGITSKSSNSVGNMFYGATTARRYVQSFSEASNYRTDEYSSFASVPSSIYHYTVGTKKYMVTYKYMGNIKYMYVYSINSSLKASLIKKIKLSCDVFGGFYQGIDGQFYVALGYNNYKESKTKTVIKVLQYSSSWKLKKTASIKGSASNRFEGIYEPFSFGNCRMDMNGSTLYMFTSRTMFSMSGVNHQSDIGFSIDTKTMKANVSNETYVSHSFNQYIKFQNGNIYLADHGDGYPRAMELTITKNFATSNEGYASALLFKMRGQTGQNYTGASLGGLEVGSKNVVVCGTAMPHYYSVKGVTGFKSNYNENVYISIANKITGKNTFKWVTTYNPKSNKTKVIGSCKQVKLSDNRFALMYSTQTGKTKTLHYIVFDNNGKKIYSKAYKGVNFTGAVQPILTTSGIIWSETVLVNYNIKLYTYAIPAKC